MVHDESLFTYSNESDCSVAFLNKFVQHDTSFVTDYDFHHIFYIEGKPLQPLS